jgi:stage V sporulation protein K
VKNKRNPISFLEDSFLSLKDYLESEISTGKMEFTAQFITELEQETKSILALCSVLNSDAAFIQYINTLANPNASNSVMLKAEHFLVSDLIVAYQRRADKQTDRSRFALAYYYDAIRNNQFADKNAVNTLNRLVASNEFKAHLDKIISQNTIASPKLKPGSYLLLSALAQQKHAREEDVLQKIKTFLQLSYGLTFKDAKELTNFLGYDATQAKSTSKFISAIPEDDSLDKVMEELNEMIGLDNIKQDIKELINLLEIQKRRSAEGLKNVEITLHTVFLGPPGTGKTTVARLLSRIFKHLGYLSKGQLCETDREGMVAGYVGQTATKVDKIVDESIGGVLFIDEAYALTGNFTGNDYGAEAVNTLLKRMEDNREDLAVIVAGYTEPMKAFIESNPGLRSRFNRFFTFKHFTPAELLLIFEGLCKKSDFIVTNDAKEKLADTFELLHAKKDEGFGNARVVRNLFEKCVQNHANRIIKLPQISQEVLKTIEEADIPEPKETQEQTYFSTGEAQEEK